MSNAFVRICKDGRCCRGTEVRRRCMVYGGAVDPSPLCNKSKEGPALVSSAVLEIQPHPLLRTFRIKTMEDWFVPYRKQMH